MDSTLRQVRESLEPFLQALEQHRFRSGVGLDVGAPPRLIPAERPELFHAAREWMEQAGSEEEKTLRRRLLAFIGGQVEDSVAREAEQDLRARLRGARVVLGNEVIALDVALERLPREEARLRRLQLENGIGHTLWESRPLFRRRIDASQRAAERIGFPSPSSVFAATSGIDVAPLRADADQMLKRTEDAFRDLLGYVLNKLDARLTALPSGDAHRSDVHAALQSVFPEVFRREDAVPAVHRWVEEFGLTLHGNGRIRTDADPREGRRPSPFVAPLKVPDDVRLAAIPTGGLMPIAQWLEALGAAQSLAHVSAKLPVEDRRLGDPSLQEAWGRLFEHLLTDALWLKRYFSLPISVARDVARMAAFHSLWRLRQTAAQLKLTAHLEQGLGDDQLAEVYADTQRAALFVNVDRRFVFFDENPARLTTRRLRGWALEARLRPVLEHRFDEDFWRNPGASGFLTRLWAQGGRDDAARLSESACAAPLSLESAGERLVRILGA